MPGRHDISRSAHTDLDSRVFRYIEANLHVVKDDTPLLHRHRGDRDNAALENRIGQDTVITSQFALWGRGGSRVIRGNLLLIPLSRSMLYVEPVFLQAEVGALPELKRAIVATGKQIAIEPTLKEALAAIFGTQAAPTEPAVTSPGGTATADLSGLINQAQQHYNQAQEYLKTGDWAGYGKEQTALQAVLEQLAKLAGK